MPTDETIITEYLACRKKYGIEIAHKAIVWAGDRDASDWAKRMWGKAQSLSRERYTDGRDQKRVGEGHGRRSAESLMQWDVPVMYVDLAELVTLKRVLHKADPRLLSHVIDETYSPRQSVRRWRAELQGEQS